jgi:phosphoglycerate dehydrogenase-like enzyme
MPKLLILSTDETDIYRQFIEEVHLPDLELTETPEDCDIILGEPRLIGGQISQFTKLKWIQSMYAGVERLMDPSLRRDYVLTNA